MAESDEALSAEIAELKKSRRAVILAHNYCRGEVQDVADYTGDSLELARRASSVDAETIVFCGVYFMAETAKILNPSRTVLIPDPKAGCAMADMITGEQVRELRAKHPGAVAVCYVNSTAAVKAECDLCVTSGNAERVLATVPADREVIFVPDRHLGGHVAKALGRRFVLWPGHCPVHAALTAKAIAVARAAHPGLKVMVHPECDERVRDAADLLLSTGGMCKVASESADSAFIVGTERGILHRLSKENPDKEFYPVGDLVCPDMKRTTLENLRDALALNRHAVEVDDEIARRARHAIEAMLAI